jgi:hypothetical protein
LSFDRFDEADDGSVIRNTFQPFVSVMNPAAASSPPRRENLRQQLLLQTAHDQSPPSRTIDAGRPKEVVH